jgi:adenylyltransferase/sulfurtransferase
VSVLVVGAGGLGAPALSALLLRGVRRVGILEPDRVELSNLHRQILYRESDVGAPKVEAAKRALLARFPDAEIEAHHGAFEATSHALVERYAVVIDGTDRFETKLAVSDACVDRGVPYVFGGVVGFDGQVLGVQPGRSACLRCLFDEAPPPGAAPTCEQLGILGPVAGIVAARQVEVALGLLEGAPSAVDRLWVYEARSDRAREIPLRRAADCRGCGPNRASRGAWAELGDDAPEAIDAPVVDLSGAVCPTTYVETRRALDRLPEGGRLWVHLTSDESARNVPASALAAGYRVLARLSDGRLHRLLLERPPEGSM